MITSHEGDTYRNDPSWQPPVLPVGAELRDGAVAVLRLRQAKLRSLSVATLDDQAGDQEALPEEQGQGGQDVPPVLREERALAEAHRAPRGQAPLRDLPALQLPRVEGHDRRRLPKGWDGGRGLAPEDAGGQGRRALGEHVELGHVAASEAEAEVSLGESEDGSARRPGEGFERLRGVGVAAGRVSSVAREEDQAVRGEARESRFLLVERLAIEPLHLEPGHPAFRFSCRPSAARRSEAAPPATTTNRRVSGNRSSAIGTVRDTPEITAPVTSGGGRISASSPLQTSVKTMGTPVSTVARWRSRKESASLRWTSTTSMG